LWYSFYAITHTKEIIEMNYTYKPKGVCSRQMNLELENGKIKSVQIIGGCDGNLKGISRLVEGMDAREAVTRLKGIRCGFKDTSCPDQLARALQEALAKEVG